MRASPNGRHAVYRADQDRNGQIELYAVTLEVPFEVRKLNGPLNFPGGQVEFFDISPDSARVVFQANPAGDLRRELFSVPIDGSLAPVRLNPPFAPGADARVASFEFSPDSTRVVYYSKANAMDVYEIFSVPIDGGAAAVKLNDDMVLGGDVFFYEVSADSSLVVYVATQFQISTFDLFSVPIDRSASPIQLNDAGEVDTQPPGVIQVSPDSSRVVFLTDQDVANVNEIYSVPIDASALTLEISGPMLTPGSDAHVFRSSPDSSRVVYAADAEVNTVHELFSVPPDGSAAPTKLNGPMVPGQSVRFTFRVAPDSSRVVYVADQDTDGVNELYSVPLDGSAAAVKLHPPLSLGQSVAEDFAIDPLSRRVVFLSNPGPAQAFELFSVPLDASAAPTRLSQDLVAGGNVTDFQIDRRGTRVAYRADALVDERTELFAAPLDGSRPARRVNADLGPGDRVESFDLAADGNRVLYLATQGVQTVELFLGSLAPLPRRR